MAALSLVSCNLEDATVEKTSLTIGFGNTRANPPVTDDAVYTLRIMAFRKTTGRCDDNNVLYTVAGADKVTHNIKPDNYDFFFIANEPPANKVMLDAVKTRDDLKKIAFDGSNFSPAHYIPMTCAVDNVSIYGETDITINDVRLTSDWEITLIRLGIRVDVVIESESPLAGDIFKGVRFSKVPNIVPILPGEYTGSTIMKWDLNRYFYIADNPSLFKEQPIYPEDPNYDQRVKWAIKLERVILPSVILPDPAVGTNALTLHAEVSAGPSPSAKLGYDRVLPNYSMPRNTHFDITADVSKVPMGINIAPSGWITTDVEGSVGSENRKLHLSQANVKITQMNGTRISFSSNMPYVWVDKTCYMVDGQERNTSDIFNELVGDTWNGNTPLRFKYDNTTGNGYMDLLVQQTQLKGGSFVPNETDYQLTLCAGPCNPANNYAAAMAAAVRRTIKAEVNNTFRHDSWGYQLPISAFFRHNETGERIISSYLPLSGYYANFDKTKKWSATVEYSPEYTGAPFVELSDTPTFDPNVATKRPGNAEVYRVKNGKASVNGYGRIYFRVGIKEGQTLPDADTDPRYAAVRIDIYDTNNTVARSFKMYVRQGEAPDYLMRPSDIVEKYGSGDWQMDGEARYEAQKIVPYNLTAPGFKGSSAATQYYVLDSEAMSRPEDYFTDYPSQGGALFAWGLPDRTYQEHNRQNMPPTVNEMKKAFNVFIPKVDNWFVDGTIQPADDNSLFRMNTYSQANNETCPPGYRRITDGSMNYRQEMTSRNDIMESELRQSLFLAPPKGYDEERAMGTEFQYEYPGDPLDGSSSSVNAEWGIVADGYYDRQLLELDNYSVASSATGDAAYAGALFYNPNNYASVFFPAPGRRVVDYENNYAGAGELGDVAQAGYYWTASLGPALPPLGSGSNAGEMYDGGVNIRLMDNHWGTTVPATVSMASNMHGQSVRCVKL